MKKLLLSFLLAGLFPALGLAQNSITGTSMDLHATFHHIGVQVNFTGDLDSNATATLEANINGAGYQTVHRLSRVGHNRFVGTIFSLPPQTSVQVRATLADPDGVTNAVHTGTITTRSEQVPVSTGSEIYVSTTGDDNTGTGSSAAPFGTIQHALDQTTAGDKVVLKAGTYHEHVQFYYNSGTVNNPITITNEPGGSVWLDGTDETYNNAAAWTSEGNNVYSIPLNGTYYIGVDGNRLWRYTNLDSLQNLYFNTDGGFAAVPADGKVYLKLPGNAAPAGHQISVSTLPYGIELSSCANIVIDGLNFRNYNLGAHSASIHVTDSSKNVWVVNGQFENMETAIRLEGFVEDLVVMDNEFSDQGVNVFNWDHVKEYQWWLERGGMYITNDGYTGRGVIFYKNYVHDMFDGVKIVGSEDDYTSYATNSEVEDNLFRHLSDDGVEVDGFSCNVRVVNNRFENMLVGVSVAPAQAGPVYVVRNVMDSLQNVAQTDYETTALKFNYDGERSGEIFIYHNTAATSEPQQSAISINNSSNWDDLYIENNIWQGTAYAFYHWLDNTSSLTINHDYDLMYAISDTIVLWDGAEFLNVSAYTAATGNCGNCLKGDPLFVNYTQGDYHLTTGSPAIDQALLIPGINDNFNGTAPDMGAFEFGAATGIQTIAKEEMRFFPNPVKDQLNFITDNPNLEYTVIAVTGQVLLSGRLMNKRLDVSQLISGFYIVKLTDAKAQKQFTIKMIKE